MCSAMKPQKFYIFTIFVSAMHIWFPYEWQPVLPGSYVSSCVDDCTFPEGYLVR